MKPVPRDDNGHILNERGTQLYTSRMEGLGATLSGISLPTDFKEILFHIESGDEILLVKGTVDGSTTARLTNAGYSVSFPIAAESGSIAAYLGVPSGTCNVSIFAWR